MKLKEASAAIASVSSASDGSGFTKNFDLFIVLLFGLRLQRVFKIPSFKIFKFLTIQIFETRS